MRRRFARVSAGDDVVATSSLVLFELWYGVARASALRRMPNESRPSCPVLSRFWTSP
ncbi:MAG: hypothetical protein WB682_04265 [Candidatus Dormiibacterota bacterium]